MKRSLPILALCLHAAADTITLQWNPNPEPTVTGYVIDYTKQRVATNTTRAAHTWLLTQTISNRLSTNITLNIPAATLQGGTNYFHLTAVDRSLLLSDLSHAVEAVKPVPVSGGGLVTVTVQSTTNFTVLSWKTEAEVPVSVVMDATNKFYRVTANFTQGRPEGIPEVSSPPKP